MNRTINIGGKLFLLDVPQVMAILNVTPDSFYSSSRKQTEQQIVQCALKAAAQGAAIIDIGGFSTRPGAANVTARQEIERLQNAIQIVRGELPDMPISIDTFRSEVVRVLHDKFGAFVVNDISGGTLDDGMFQTVGLLGLPYIMGHIKGAPQNMAQYAVYDNIMQEIIQFYVEQLSRARAELVKDIILDPCFGFAKTIDHNYSLLKHFAELSLFGLPLLAALSRKSMIFKPLGITPQESLAGTVALHWAALSAGAVLLRAHDVLQAKQVITLYQHYENAK